MVVGESGEEDLMSRAFRGALLIVGLLVATRCAHQPEKPVDNLPPLEVDPFTGLDSLGEDETQAFTFRKGPAPPPDVSERVKLGFPPPPAPSRMKPPAAPELKVLRTQPSGENALVGAVTATFNQPMVPVAALDELRRWDAPLEITPKPEGRFRWLGTSTVTFEPKGRMPFATRFQIRIPAGTRALSGKTLERETRWELSTPRVEIVSALPYRHSNQNKPDTPIALLFNQRIDPSAVHAALSVRGGGSPVALELVPRGEWPKLKYLASGVATWEPERTVVVRPTRPLELATSFTVTLRAGLKGEGPLPTTSDQHHYFSSYGPLRVDEIRCSDSRCNPDWGFTVVFTNPLTTPEDELAKLIKVTPAPADLEIKGAGTYFTIRGSFKPRSLVAIEVARGPRDVHDQELAEPARKELKTGDLYPMLTFPAHGHAVMESRGDRKVPLDVTSVTSSRLRLVKVQREQLPRVIELARYSYDDDGKRDPLKEIKGLVVTRTLKTGVRENGRARIGLPTDEALGKGGQGVLYLELKSEELKRFDKWANPFRGLVVNVTDLGLMARYDHDRIIVMATGLESGKPLAGIKLEIRDRKGEVVWEGKTGADGTALAPGRRELKGQPAYVLWAERGRDSTFLQLEGGNPSGNYLSSYTSWGYAPAKKHLKMFLFTDRNPYRPGETVHLKGVLRQEDTTPEGGIEPLPAGVRDVKIRVESPRGNKLIENKEVKVSASGAFSVDVAIPVGADLGHYSVYVVSSEGSAYGAFQVEEYRAPEFEVKVETGEGPFFLGDTVKARAGADYLFGAPMAGAEARYSVRREEASFRPPKHDGFSFGEAVPIWWRWSYGHGRRGGRYGGYAYGSGAAGTIVKQGTGRLDATGRIAFEHKLRPDEKDRRHGPASFTIETEVFDQNRQTIANRKILTAHPASLYLGLRPEKTVVKAGEPTKVAAVLCKLDGARVAGTPLKLRALQVETKVTTVKEGGTWQYKYESRELEADACELRSAKDPASCELTLKKPGMYLLRSETRDERGRLARTTLTIYAYGPGYVPWRLENQSKIELVPDKESYQPGETARVLVKSPLRDARGFLTISRSGMVSHKLLELSGNAQVVEVPISEKHLPELFVGVALSRGRLKDASLGKASQDLGRPTFAHGQVKLAVSIEEKRLRVEVKPRQLAVLPSGTLDLELATRDQRGRGVSAEVAVMVVDEGVLSLLGYQTPDPLAYFWASRGADTALADNRNALLKRELGLKPPPSPRRSRNGNGMRLAAQRVMSKSEVAAAPAEAAPAPDFKAKSGYAGKKDSGGAPRIRSRSLFATTAYYNPGVETDEQGRASLKIKMPDNLTTFRIMAVVLDRTRADRFGRGDAQVKVRKPLLLRPSLPRFLSVGDRFEAAVMVHNETEQDGEVDVLVRGRNLKALGPQRKRVKIAAHRALEVRFAMAPETAGPARVQFAAVLSGKDAKPETDAVEKQIPVLLPATTEAFATYGMTESSISQTVIPPKDALPGYGGLEVSMSSTALNGLEDSVRYLVDYPFECTEQTASRILPIFALKDILKDFKIAKLGDLAAQKQLSEDGVRKLLGTQRWDGGWGMWPGARISWPYLTAYALFTLERAREAGYKVAEDPLRRGRQFLKRILDYPRSEFGEEYNFVAQVLSVWALSERKQHERKHLKRLYENRKRLPLFAKVWLMQAIFRADGKNAEVLELLRELNNAAVESASAAHFSEIATESLRLLMHSEERTDAIALYALLEVDPDHALMPKLARGLISSRVKGHWSTTQANAYALTALARYYKQVEKVVPDYVASLWLGEEGYLGQAAFKGRQMRVVQQEVPMNALQKLGREKEELILSKQGPGKLYYRIGLRYAPKSLRLPPEEQGFAVTRSYEPIEDAKDSVVRQKDGVWRVKAGSYVRVRLTVVVPDRRYFVAVLDPLPAGLEAVNLGFATTASSRLGNQLKNKVYDFYSWYAFFAFDHQELRDESVVLFADRLPSGVYEYTYLARATTLGRFVAAPTKAEEMYHPETFGRTATAIVEVK
jgi:uncharacterized protein YfaS (alpha-2-macroglobulin family)